MAKRSVASGPKPRQEPAPKDVALVVGKTEDDGGYHVVRRRDEDQPLELGTIRPLREGKNIDGEVVSLRPREDVPFAFDVKTELPAPKRATEGGPAQVATDKYRAGWDAIWGAAGEAPRRLN